MKTVYDVQQLLKQFGTIIYVGDRLADLELMEEEVKELYQSQLIDAKQLQAALFILRQEAQMERKTDEKRMRMQWNHGW
ncbi:YqgQ family protein [Bacillus megaterium]|nr:YqgQ family protein [Priestia megaterium]